MGFQKLHDVSCKIIRFWEGYSRCGLVFVFHKAGGSWSKVRRLPQTFPPPYASRTQPARAFLLLFARTGRFCLFLSGKRRNHSPSARAVWRRQDGERGRSVIITTRRAPFLRYTIHQLVKTKHNHHGAHHRSPAKATPSIQCHKLFSIINISRARCRR